MSTTEQVSTTEHVPKLECPKSYHCIGYGITAHEARNCSTQEPLWYIRLMGMSALSFLHRVYRLTDTMFPDDVMHAHVHVRCTSYLLNLLIITISHLQCQKGIFAKNDNAQQQYKNSVYMYIHDIHVHI